MPMGGMRGGPDNCLIFFLMSLSPRKYIHYIRYTIKLALGHGKRMNMNNVHGLAYLVGKPGDEIVRMTYARCF